MLSNDDISVPILCCAVLAEHFNQQFCRVTAQKCDRFLDVQHASPPYSPTRSGLIDVDTG